MNHKPDRFLSLDVFRGMTICFMIIVNTPGSGARPFAPLEHAAWFGFTPTDLVFPSFLFAVGNAMSFTTRKFDSMSTGWVLSKILKRAALIFLTGYLMYWFPFVEVHNGAWSVKPISHTRIMGVLQRIALCYLFASLMVYFIKLKRIIIALSIFLLVGYEVLLLIYGDPAAPYGMLTNAGTYLDKYLLGDNHLYHGEGMPFDPEGILGTLPAIVNVIGGYFAGRFIQERGKGYETISKLLLTGCLFLFIAWCWNMSFPMGKKLWSSPFTLHTVGLDLIIISALIYAVELRSWNAFRLTSFFVTAGKNPLAIYILSEILIIAFWMIHITKGVNLYEWLNSNIYQVIAPGAVGSLLFAISYMLICWAAGKLLEKNNIYIRV